MDSEPIVGIDLGTTNSEVAILSGGRPEIVREDGDPVLPSCVGLDEAGNVVVGRQARNQAAAAPERTVLSIKRLMGSGERVSMGAEEYTPQEISAFIGARAAFRCPLARPPGVYTAPVHRIHDGASRDRAGGSRLPSGAPAVAGDSARPRDLRIVP